jgi:predicted DCC family thiol-disulfide oxidoreductase YuxK
MSAEAGREIWIVYDGQCPFCTRYVLLYKIGKQVEKVHMIDARSDHPIVAEIRRRGLKLDNGMAVKWNGGVYHGPAAMHVLAMLGSEETSINWVNRILFSRPLLARFLYPMLVAGRRLTVRLLGRPPIADT